MASDWEELKVRDFGLVYLGVFEGASVFENDTRYLNFPAANGINRHF